MEEKHHSMISRIINFYVKIITLLIVILMISLISFVTLMILGRYIPFIPRFLWTDEGARFSLIWVVFLSSILGIREGKHFYVDVLPQDLPRSTEIILRTLYYLFAFSISLIFVLYGRRFFLMGFMQNSEMTGLNLGTIYISVPIAGISWIIFLLENIFIDLNNAKGNQSRCSH